jgi:hypothetical protein
MANVIAQISGLLASVINIGGIQFKNKKHILIAFISANIFYCIDFLIIKAYAGFFVSFISIILPIFVYRSEKSNKPLSKVILSIFILLSIVANLTTFTTFFDILPILAFILYSSSIIQKRESNLRLLTLIQITCWILYNLHFAAYTLIISDVFFISSTLIAIFRLDILPNRKPMHH